MTLDAAASMLGADLFTLDGEGLRRAHREAAAKAHPDVGGSEEAMRAVNEARDLVADWLSSKLRDDVTTDEEKVCARCGGSRELKVKRGFFQVKIACPDCSVGTAKD